MFLTPQIVTSKPQFKNAFSAFPICYLSQLKHLNMNAFIPGKHARRTSFIKPELSSLWELKPLANGRNIVGQQLSTLLDVTCCVRLHTLLHVVAQSLKPVKLFSQQLPTFLLFRDRRSVAFNLWDVVNLLRQQCWELLRACWQWCANGCNISQNVGRAVQTDPTLLAQQCWELLRPFARILTNKTNYNHYVILICFSVLFSHHVIVCNFSLLYYLTTEYIL